jgi:DNA-binding NarL/FixJ family response regulator
LHDEDEGMKRRILIADEADLMLIGIQTILKDTPICEITGSARSANELLEMGKRLSPDVIILSEQLDALVDVLALVERLRQVTPRPRLVVLGGLTEGLLIRDLFACGVLAYLFEGDDLKDHLLPAIGAVLQERPYLSPTANSAYLVAMQSPLRDWQLDPEARAMLRLLARGMHVNDIAAQMDVPLRRIYWVRQKLRKRFGANTNEHLISMAVTEGFASTDH